MTTTTTTNRERLETVLKRLRDPSPANVSVSDEECADIIESLMRENEALRKHVEKLQRELAFVIDSDRQAHDHN